MTVAGSKRMLVGQCVAAVALTFVACSTEPSYPGEELQLLPPGVAGMVTLGGKGLESSGSNSLLFLFDAEGEPLGHVVGPEIAGNSPIAFDGGIAATSGDAVTILQSSDRIEVPIDQWRTTGTVTNGDEAALWFGEARSSEYVVIDDTGEAARGSIPALVVASVFCDRKLLTIVSDVADGTHTLYGNKTGSEPVEVGIVTLPDDYGFTTRDLVCLPGDAAVALLTSKFAYQQPMRPSLTTIDTATGQVDSTVVGVPIDTTGNYRGRPITLLDDRVVWLTDMGDVMSTSVADPATTERLWSIPNFDNDSSALSIRGEELIALDYSGIPTFSRYDIATGDRTVESIELRWLTRLIGAAAGNTVYGITGVGYVD